MYNEERKNTFIKEYGGTERSQYYVKTVFAKFEEIEQERQVDVCELPADELEIIINSSSSVRTESAERVFVVLKKYVAWCRANGFTVNDKIFDIKVDILETYKTQMFKSPSDLKSKIDRIFEENKLENDTVGVIYKAYIWMVYCGISETEALGVNINDVNIDNLTVTLDENKIIKLSEISRDVFEIACTISEFRYSHNNYNEDIMRPRHPGTTLIRTYKSEKMTQASIRTILTRLSVSSGVKLSHKKIFYSGLFFRMYMDEFNGLQTTFLAHIDEEMQKEFVTNKNRTINKIRNHKIRTLMLDYEKWKAAFVI